MKYCSRAVVSTTLVVIVVFALLCPQVRAAVSVTTLARLGGTPDGYDPQGSLIVGGDGSFYGTTEAGGPANCGTVYRIAPDGTFATLYTFTGGNDGANPKAALLDGGDGFFYGTTSSGGANGDGTIFKVTPAGVFTLLYGFTALDTSLHNTDGASPQAALVSGGDGFFYGTAASGGPNGFGAIFRITASGVFNAVYSPSQSSDGFAPQAALTPGGDGYFYGSTSYGGTGHGTIFRVTPAGVYQVLYNFANGTDGAFPESALVPSGGVFYGLTETTFFSVTSAGALTTLYTFNTPNGKGIFSGLIAGPGGNFYGTALKDSPDGTGNLFQLTPAGGFTLLHKFDTGADGASPVPAPVLDAAGNLYGVAETGGDDNDTGGGGGTVYEYSTAGAFTVLHDFVAGASYCVSPLLQYSDGNFYGLTQQGGAENGGTFFGVAPDGADVVPLLEFDPDTQGSHPNAALVLAGDGSLYGSLAADGPDGGGTIFQMAPGASASTAAHASGSGGFHTDFTLDPIHPFDPFGFILNLFCNTGEYPGPGDNATLASVTAAAGPVDQTIYGAITPSALVFAANGTLYGILQEGGDGGGGAIFSRVPGSAPAVIHSFGVTAGDGILPEGLTRGTDGNLYGITYGGGTASDGTIFKLGSDGTYAVLYSFQGAGDGANSQTNLTAGSDGNLYGVTQSGYGTIFSITPGGAFTTLHTFASDNSEGSQPMGALLQAGDGNLYGTTQDGVLFSVSHGGTVHAALPPGLRCGDGRVQSLHGRQPRRVGRAAHPSRRRQPLWHDHRRRHGRGGRGFQGRPERFGYTHADPNAHADPDPPSPRRRLHPPQLQPRRLRRSPPSRWSRWWSRATVTRSRVARRARSRWCARVPPRPR